MLRKTAKHPKPLWPYREDDPEVMRMREEEERRRKEEELLRKQEEERKQSELAEQQKAAQAKGGKPGAPLAKPAPAGPP